MDFRSSENSVTCCIFSKVLFSKFICATILKKSAFNACGSISMLSGEKLTSFTTFSIDGSANGDRNTTMRGFSVSNHQIILLPYSLISMFSSFIN